VERLKQKRFIWRAENQRLFDLVRGGRQYLHNEDLITDKEFVALVMDDGSGQRVERLETYDELRAELATRDKRIAELEEGLRDALKRGSFHAEDKENALFGTVARLVGANDRAMAKEAEATKLRAERTERALAQKRIAELEDGARDILYEMDRSCGRDVLVSRIRMDKLASLLSPAKAEPKCAKCGGSRIWHSENGFLDIPCPDCGGTK